MKCVAVDAPGPFSRGGRGADVTRWITHRELYLPGPDDSVPEGRGDIVGAIVEDHWVVFHGLQVIQFVPDEVHTGWQYGAAESECSANAWRVVGSDWIKTFDPSHLAGHHHFVLQFYEETVELICRDLVFGEGDFLISEAAEVYPQFCHAYLHLARSLEKVGRMKEASALYERYVARESDRDMVAYAKRCLEHLKSMQPRQGPPANPSSSC